MEKENKKTKKILNIITAVLLLAVCFISGVFMQRCVFGGDGQILSEIVHYLREYGVFDSTSGQLVDLSEQDAADILLGNILDNYAKYYSPEEYKMLRQNKKGDYAGIGISVGFYEEGLTVVSIVTNSPAYYRGIKLGDVILTGEYKQAKKSFASMQDFTNFLNEIPQSEEFILSILRDGGMENIQISKEEYEKTYVEYKDSEQSCKFLSENYGDKPEITIVDSGLEELALDVAYISLSSFEGSAETELKKALDYMEERGRTKLIFDLRNNGGGYMSVLSDIASYFIGENSSPIAYAKDNDGDFETYNSAGDNTPSHVKAISVIANENTASASECLIGAMLYYKHNFDIDRLIIENQDVEESAHTYGKGIMQTTFLLSNGGALKLTTAVIYQPDKNTCIHGKGIIVQGSNALKASQNKAIEHANAILLSKN